MLKDIKDFYIERADNIPNWKKTSISELCFKYLDLKESDPNLAQDYLSAIICRFYPRVYKNFYGQTKQYVSEGDCYDWLTTAIIYTLNAKAWENPNSTLYQDKNAPEKAIYVKMHGAKLNHWTASMRDKRRLDTESASLDELSEDASEYFYIPYYDSHSFLNDYIKDSIKLYFKNKDYFPAFMIDLILNSDVFDTNKDTGELDFNDKRLKHFFLNLTDSYCKIFSEEYDLSLNSILRASSYIRSMKSEDVDKKIAETRKRLMRDKEFISYLKD